MESVGRLATFGRRFGSGIGVPHHEFLACGELLPVAEPSRMYVNVYISCVKCRSVGQQRERRRESSERLAKIRRPVGLRLSPPGGRRNACRRSCHSSQRWCSHFPADLWATAPAGGVAALDVIVASTWITRGESFRTAVPGTVAWESKDSWVTNVGTLASSPAKNGESPAGTRTAASLKRPSPSVFTQSAAPTSW
jgi:hypothetical protein